MSAAQRPRAVKGASPQEKVTFNKVKADLEQQTNETWVAQNKRLRRSNSVEAEIVRKANEILVTLGPNAEGRPNASKLPAPVRIVEILDYAGLTGLISPIIVKRFQKTEFEFFTLPPEEQYDRQMKDLYAKALDGDMAAKKLWFDLQGEATKGDEFNIKVEVTPYTVKDKSLGAIAQKADWPFVVDILKGIIARCVKAEAPHELRKHLRDALKDFEEWAPEAYKAVNA